MTADRTSAGRNRQMWIRNSMLATSALVVAAILVATPASAFAQGRDKPDKSPATISASITLTPDVRIEIRDYYETRTPVGAKALPPGIRKNLARGKPLPPGIAKRFLPGELRSRIEIPKGYEIIEVGLDVLLVEVATNIVHDVLMDAVR
ncbi:MAG: anti-virulence regulator CigR family protein [Gemmatimonadota bacterium]